MPKGVRKVQTPGASADTNAPDAPKPEVTETPEPEASADEPNYRTLRASEVDPTKIRRGVLTLDGWVCPVTSPAPPARQ